MEPWTPSSLFRPLVWPCRSVRSIFKYSAPKECEKYVRLHHLGNDTAAFPGQQENDLTFILRPIANVDRSVITVEVETVKGRVFDHPLRHFEHTLVGNKKIDRCTETFANRLFAS